MIHQKDSPSTVLVGTAVVAAFLYTTIGVLYWFNAQGLSSYTKLAVFPFFLLAFWQRDDLLNYIARYECENHPIISTIIDYSVLFFGSALLFGGAMYFGMEAVLAVILGNISIRFHEILIGMFILGIFGEIPLKGKVFMIALFIIFITMNYSNIADYDARTFHVNKTIPSLIHQMK